MVLAISNAAGTFPLVIIICVVSAIAISPPNRRDPILTERGTGRNCNKRVYFGQLPKNLFIFMVTLRHIKPIHNFGVIIWR